MPNLFYHLDMFWTCSCIHSSTFYACWREPNFGLLEALTASDQAEITHTLDPLIDHHNAIT